MEEFSFNGISSYVDVIKVIDGDTINISLDIELKINKILSKNGNFKFSIRLYGINCCELHSKDENERKFAKNAKERLSELVVLNNNKVFLKMYGYDKYGRILGEIYASEDEEVSFNKILLNENLAKKYYGTGEK